MTDDPIDEGGRGHACDAAQAHAIQSSEHVVKVERKVRRLTRRQMFCRLMPLVQDKLLQLIERWQMEGDALTISERETKVLGHLIGVIEKLMALDAQSRAIEPAAQQKKEQSIDLQYLRNALEDRLGQIINASGTGGIYSEPECS